MKTYLQKYVSAAPLSVFRIVFGLMIFISIVRFWSKGWIHELYIEPKYFFSFYGFEFVKPIGDYTYFIFVACAISALMVAAGLFYRFATIGLFVSFTFIELMDKSTYLNHYYFVSMVCFLLMFIPAHAYFSIDSYRNKRVNAGKVPKWSIDALKLFICLVYVFAGLAKVNSDWLLEALPLKIWLPAKNDMPFIGSLFNHVWVAYVFCWMGCIYDLTIPFLLLGKSTRIFAYAAVVVFHALTSMLFPIGMFPFIMIAGALIFFSADFHERIISTVGSWFNISAEYLRPKGNYQFSSVSTNCIVGVLALFFFVQALLPFRYLAYPGELFWTEEGYRFSWRVMLIEKAGYAQFTIKDDTGRQIGVDNREFLTPLQEKMMSTQADMILQYAHMLRDHYSAEGLQNPKVYVDSYVGLNGRLGKPLVDPSTDLAVQHDSFAHKPWILRYSDEIKGL